MRASVLHARDAACFVREIEHTADVGFEVEAPTLAGCFERAALGLAGVIAGSDTVVARERRELAVRAGDRVALLHDFLHAVLLLAQVDRFLVSAVEVSLSDDRLVRAVVAGEPLDVTCHRLHGEVKAVTWHGLSVDRVDEGWRARVILDV